MELYNAYYEWAGNVGDSILKLAQPEDVPVPLDVFTALAKLVTGSQPSKKMTMQIRASLATLLNCE